MGIRPFTTASLSQPETNVRIGIQHFKDLVDKFGGIHYALASYNAGELVVRRWWARRPHGQGLDEWIETIPYLETRLYVKAILADWISYRELYEPGGDETAVARGVSQSTS